MATVDPEKVLDSKVMDQKVGMDENGSIRTGDIDTVPAGAQKRGSLWATIFSCSALVSSEFAHKSQTIEPFI